MASISETELQRRLRALEKKAPSGGTSYVGGSAPTGTNYENGDTHYDSVLNNLWLFNDGTWNLTSKQLHIYYADNVTNVNSDGTVNAQNDVTGFSQTPFDSGGTQKAWRGLWWGPTDVASTDPTDYEWTLTSGEAGDTPSYTRYYTTYPGLLSELGDPDNAGTGVTWTAFTGTAPSTAYWVAEKFTVGTDVSPWAIYPVQAKEGGFPLIKYVVSGSNMPTLGDSTWVADVIEAVEYHTGRDYSNQKELGLGTVASIKYDNGTLRGKYTIVNGSDTWVAPDSFIDGDLIVEQTIAGDSIQANTIQASHLAATAITTSQLATVELTADNITSGTMSGNHIYGGVMEAVTIVAGTIDVGYLKAVVIDEGSVTIDTNSANKKYYVNGVSDADNVTGSSGSAKASLNIRSHNNSGTYDPATGFVEGGPAWRYKDEFVTPSGSGSFDMGSIGTTTFTRSTGTVTAGTITLKIYEGNTVKHTQSQAIELQSSTSPSTVNQTISVTAGAFTFSFNHTYIREYDSDPYWYATYVRQGAQTCSGNITCSSSGYEYDSTSDVGVGFELIYTPSSASSGDVNVTIEDEAENS